KYQAFYEGGTRVCAIMRWPGKIPAGSTCNEMVAGFDLFTTFAKFAGAEIPKDRIIDGKDISALMFGEKDAKSPHDAFYYYQNFRLCGVRQGKWKLVFEGGGPQGRGKVREALYDLDNDLGETKSVAEQHPDIVEKLRLIAEQAREDLGDAAKNRPGKNRREPGKV